MVENIPDSPIASSSSKSQKGRLIPSSFRKAGKLTNDQQIRLLRIQAAKIHIQDWETLGLINYCLLNNSFESILSILYEYARCLDRIEKNIERIHEILIKLEESIQTTQLSLPSFDDIINSAVQAIIKILTTICSLRSIQGTPISFYENNSKIITSPHVSDNEPIFKLFDKVSQHLETYCTKYKVDLSTLSSVQLVYIFAATIKVNPSCNKKIVDNSSTKELRASINKLNNLELKINAAWEKMDNLESLQYPTLKVKLDNTCPSSLQFFHNDISTYDSLIAMMKIDFTNGSTTQIVSPVVQLTVPLVKGRNGITVTSGKNSIKSAKTLKTQNPVNKKKEKVILTPTDSIKSQKQSATKIEPVIAMKQIEAKLTSQNIPDSQPTNNSAETSSQVSTTADKESHLIQKVLPNAKHESNDSSSSDEAMDDVRDSKKIDKAINIPRSRSVSIAVMERSDSLKISKKLEDNSKKRRSTVIGIPVDTVTDTPVMRTYSVKVRQMSIRDPNIGVKTNNNQDNPQDVLQTSFVPFNPSRRNSSAKSLKSVSDMSSDDYDEAPYEDVDPDPIKTTYTSSSFDIGSMNSFNYDAYDKTSHHYNSNFTPSSSPARARTSSAEVINRTRSESIEKIRGRTNSDDVNSPKYKQHKRQVSKTQELFSSITSLLSPYTPGASKSESQLIHLALRDLQSSGHTSGTALVAMAAKKIALWWSFVGPRLKLKRRMVIRNFCIEVINMCAYRAVSKSISKRKRRFRWLLNHAALQIQKSLKLYMRRKYQGRQFNYISNNTSETAPSPFNRRRTNSKERTWSPLPSTPERVSQKTYHDAIVRPSSGNKGLTRPESGATTNSGKSSDSGGKKTSSTEEKSSKNRARTRSSEDESSRSRTRTRSGEDGSISKGSRRSQRTRQKSITFFAWMTKSPSARAWHAAILIQKVLRRYLAIARVDKLFISYDALELERNSRYQGSLWSMKHRNQGDNEARKKAIESSVTIQRAIRGKLARKRSFNIVKAGVLLNRKLNEFKSLKQLRMRLRRIERPLVIKLDNIYNIPNGVIRSENVKVVVSIWWSSLLHIVSELDFGTIIEGKKPQVQVKLENVPILKQTPELLQTLNTYLETDSAMATEKKQYDRENLSKRNKKVSVVSFPTTALKPIANIAGGGDGGHKRLGSILATLESLEDHDEDDDDDDDDDDDSSSDVADDSIKKEDTVSRSGSILMKRFEDIRKTRVSFLPSIRHSLSGLGLGLFSSSRRESIVESKDIVPSCLDLQGRTIRVPGCHGNSVIKVEIYDDDRKIGNKVFFLSRHGGWLFWGGKYSEEIKLIGASRLENSSRRNSTADTLRTKINYVIKSGEALHSKAAQSIYVKIRGTGPAKLATRTKGLDFSFFEKKFPFFISLNYEDGLGLYHKKTNLEAFYVVPAKDIMSVRLEQGQWVDGGSTMQDSHEIILNTNTYDEIIIRLDSVGNRVRWLEIFENILQRNAAAILKFQQQRSLYSNITKIAKIFDRSPKNQGPVVRRLRGGLNG